MKNIIKDISKGKNPQAISAPEEKTDPKKGRIVPIKCIGQGVPGEWEEGGGAGGMQLPSQMGG